MLIEDYEIHDAIRLQKLLQKHRKKGLSIWDCREMWRVISQEMDAGWLIMPKNVKNVLGYVDAYYAKEAKEDEDRRRDPTR